MLEVWRGGNFGRKTVWRRRLFLSGGGCNDGDNNNNNNSNCNADADASDNIILEFTWLERLADGCSGTQPGGCLPGCKWL